MLLATTVLPADNASQAIIFKPTLPARSVLPSAGPAIQLLLAPPVSYNTPSTLAKLTVFSVSPTLTDVNTAQLALLVKPATKDSIFPRPRLALSARLP